MENKKHWNNQNVEVVKVGTRYFALDGWNGERYYNCWEVDEKTFKISNAVFILEPVYEGVGEPDQDGDYVEYKIVDYKIC